MKNASALHLKSEVFNNVERPLKAQSSTEVVNNVGKVKGTACTEQCLWQVWKPVWFIFLCVCDAAVEMCVSDSF